MQRLAPCLALLLACGGASPSTSDGAPADAVSTAASIVRIDGAAVAYPPMVRKIGFNSQWNTISAADEVAIDTAAAGGVGLVAGLVETAEGPGDHPGDPDAVIGPTSRFVRVGDAVQVLASPRLGAVRRRVADHGMVTLVQLAGMPCASTRDACNAAPGVFTRDPAMTLSDGGNWYPLTVPDQVPALADALARFAAATIADDGAPTIWALWQEPDHTLSGAPGFSKEASVRAYLGLYRPWAEAVRRAIGPDAMIAGPQQNQATGTNHDHSIDGAGYRAFVTNLGVGVGEGAAVPLDFVTIQDYEGATTTRETIENTRIAYADPRFARTPVMFNEWDLSKDLSFAQSYDDPARLAEVLDALVVILDAPDVAAGLVMRGLFTAAPAVAQGPVRFLGTFPPLRRPVTVSGPAAGAITGVAAADDGGARVLLWSRSADEQVVDLELDALPAGLVDAGARVVVETLGPAGSAIAFDGALAGASIVVPKVTVPPGGVVMVSVGAPPDDARRLVAARYARHVAWVPRRGPADWGPPAGTGAYDVRAGQIVVGVDGPSGVGSAGVVIRDVPSGYAVDLAFDSAGLPGSGAGVLAVRVDYLDGDDSVAAVIYRDPRFTGALPVAPLFAGAQPAPETRTRELVGTVTLPIDTDAPPGWPAPRRALISVTIAGMPSPVTVAARLAD